MDYTYLLKPVLLIVLVMFLTALSGLIFNIIRYKKEKPQEEEPQDVDFNKLKDQHFKGL